MTKKTFGPQPLLYVEPTTLVGANVDGKANFAAVAWTGIACGEPPMISIALRHTRYTLKGIHQNMTFSVNVPSIDLVTETDYCGIVSGKDTDKVKDCKFKVFYGNLQTAPLIEQCPINLECEATHFLNLGSHILVIGRITETHVNEDCITEGHPDITKVKPFAFGPMKYYPLGDAIASAFKVGWEVKPKTK